MIEYKSESTLRIVEIIAIHLDYPVATHSIEDDRIYHSLEGAFYYCGLVLDGFLIMPEEMLNAQLPQWDLAVECCTQHHTVVRSGKACRKGDYFVRHVSTDNMEDDDEEDEFYFVVLDR
jgi:hypothetical protein